MEIPLSELHPFKDHPFKVKDDEAMMETADSIRQYGVLVPAIVRPDPNGGYELVAGHRRHRASELAGKDTKMCIRDRDMMRVIMCEEKKSDLDRVTFTSDTLRKYFPKSYTPQRMQETLSLIHISANCGGAARWIPNAR